jgi:hypothetical protein
VVIVEVLDVTQMRYCDTDMCMQGDVRATAQKVGQRDEECPFRESPDRVIDRGCLINQSEEPRHPGRTIPSAGSRRNGSGSAPAIETRTGSSADRRDVRIKKRVQ